MDIWPITNMYGLSDAPFPIAPEGDKPYRNNKKKPDASQRRRRRKQAKESRRKNRR